MTDKGIIIFVKNPILGKVKTRLAKEVGNNEALEIYLKLLSFTKNQVENSGINFYVFYSDFVDLNDFWEESSHRKFLQLGRDLGDKMKQAFDEILKLHKKVIIIGSDCPLLTSSIINRAFTELKSTDCVIGPAEDGGYYLLGLKQNEESIFRDIEWSTDKVFTQTILKLELLGFSYNILDTLPDIDYKRDWENYGHFI